jgi:hypothetical protein
MFSATVWFTVKEKKWKVSFFEQKMGKKIDEASDKPKKRSLFQRLIHPIVLTESSQDNTEEKINEDSKGDFLALDDEDLIFSEKE